MPVTVSPTRYTVSLGMINPHTPLSSSARLVIYLGPITILLLIFRISPRTGIFSPVASIPTILFYRLYFTHLNINGSNRANLESLVWNYASILTIGFIITILIQEAMGSLTLTMLFGRGAAKQDFWAEFRRKRNSLRHLSLSELTHRAKLAASWPNWGFNAYLSYPETGLVEELLKFMPVLYARSRGEQVSTYIDFALAGASSFRVVETIGFLYGAVEHSAGGRFLALTIFERIIGGTLGHLLTAALTGLRARKRERSWWMVIGPSLFLHGSWNFIALAASAREGNVGWVHPTGVGNTVGLVVGILAVLGLACWLVKREWAAREKEERYSAGWKEG